MLHGGGADSGGTLEQTGTDDSNRWLRISLTVARSKWVHSV